MIAKALAKRAFNRKVQNASICQLSFSTFLFDGTLRISKFSALQLEELRSHPGLYAMIFVRALRPRTFHRPHGGREDQDPQPRPRRHLDPSGHRGKPVPGPSVPPQRERRGKGPPRPALVSMPWKRLPEQDGQTQLQPVCPGYSFMVAIGIGTPVAKNALPPKQERISGKGSSTQTLSATNASGENWKPWAGWSK
ncbi:hypothetical protein LAX5112_04962 [Roseibium alexandrii]|uniref:Uncharacterized protein n=1 Tax=Roseibium alexandrii TaxID=388408 RepID=A0A0M7ATI6_9HYPH|nr:hypothetical protein LAX5112_04962 [Roseibium alexandrii]